MDPVMKAALQIKRVTVDPSLKLYIPLNEGSGGVAKDYSKYGNNGVLTDVEWGINGGVFNGTSAYLDCGNDSSLDITDAFTLEVWVKPADLSSGYYWVGGKSEAFEFAIHDNGRIYCYVSNVDKYSRSDILSWSNGVWYHIAVGTRDGTTEGIKIYRNGIEISTSVVSSGTISSNNNAVYIGAYAGSLHHFNGTIDEVRIYNRALSALEILTDYEAERGRYGV
jgi:hypothetical protein